MRKVRKDKHISLEAIRLATGLDLSIVSLSRKLSGKQTITPEEIAKIAKAIGMRVSLVAAVPAAVEVRLPVAGESAA